MPVRVQIGGEETLLKPNPSFQLMEIADQNLSISVDYYIYVNEVKINKVPE